MEIILGILAVGGFVGGYAFRGAIRKEITTLGVDAKAEVVALRADFAKFVADVKAKV